MLEKLRDFFQYGPLLTQRDLELRKRQVDRAKKRAAARRAAVREAEKDLTGIDKYVFGITGEDVIRNRRIAQRRKMAAAAAADLTPFERYVLRVTGEDVLRNREKLQSDAWRVRGVLIDRAQNHFRQDYADEIQAQTRGALRIQGKSWYKTTDADIARARRQAERELWREVKDEYPWEEYT